MGESDRQTSFLQTIKAKCLEYVPMWKGLKMNDLIVEKLVGGCTNLLWKVHQAGEPVEPIAVVFRKYCSSEIVERATEEQIMSLMGKEGITTRIFHNEEAFRIEEFIAGTHPPENDIFSESLLKIMAQLHNHKDFDKEPCSFARTKTLLKLSRGIIPQLKDNVLQGFRNLDSIRAEVEWLEEQIKAAGSEFRMGLCHNDIHALNILQTEKKSSYYAANDTNLILIDFEYADYNYIACEWANSFYERCINNAAPEWPHFSKNEADFPSRASQRPIIARYLQYLNHTTPARAEVESFLDQIQICLLIQHLHWALWSVPSYHANTFNNAIQWGYAEYGEFRLKEYYTLKKTLIDNKILGDHTTI